MANGDSLREGHGANTTVRVVQGGISAPFHAQHPLTTPPERRACRGESTHLVLGAEVDMHGANVVVVGQFSAAQDRGRVGGGLGASAEKEHQLRRRKVQANREPRLWLFALFFFLKRTLSKILRRYVTRMNRGSQALDVDRSDEVCSPQKHGHGFSNQPSGSLVQRGVDQHPGAGGGGEGNPDKELGVVRQPRSLGCIRPALRETIKW